MLLGTAERNSLSLPNLTRSLQTRCRCVVFVGVSPEEARTLKKMKAICIIRPVSAPSVPPAVRGAPATHACKRLQKSLHTSRKIPPKKTPNNALGVLAFHNKKKKWPDDFTDVVNSISTTLPTPYSCMTERSVCLF